MTILTRNQKVLLNKSPVYGGPYGGYSLTTDFFCKMTDGYSTNNYQLLAEKIATGGSGFDENIEGDNGSMSFNTTENAIYFPDAITNIRYWTGTDFPVVGANEDCVMVVVLKPDSGSSPVIQFGDTANNYFRLGYNRLAVKNTRGYDLLSSLGDEFPDTGDDYIAVYMRGDNAVNASFDYGWVARSDSSLAVTESEAAVANEAITGILDVDLASGGYAYFFANDCLVHSILLCTYPSNGAPSAAVVKEAAQWHVDNHTTAEALADPSLRVPYHKL